MKILLVFSAFLVILSAESLNVCDKLTKENFAKQNFVLEAGMSECDGSALKIEQLGRLLEISKISAENALTAWVPAFLTKI